MAVDDLALFYLLVALVATVLTVNDKQVFILHKEKFQLPASFQYWKTVENANIIFFYVALNKFIATRVKPNSIVCCSVMSSDFIVWIYVAMS